MAVSNNYEIKNYTLDGIATQFAIPFDVNVDDYGNAINIVVYLGLDELELNVDYTISVKTINYPDAVNHTGEKLTVFRRTPIEQPVDFVDNGNFTLEDIETGLDRSIMIEQETSANLDNTIRAQESAERAEQYKDIAIEKASDAEDWAVGTRSDEQTPAHSLESAKHWAEAADTSASMATSMRNQSAANALVSEGYAKGTQGGVPVESGDYYQDNSKYYKEQAGTSATSASASATKASEWADKHEDSEVETGRYSAKHWAAKASTSAGGAAVSAYNAGQSETKAGKWAEEAEDVEVETGKYSAKHYSLKASASATSAESDAEDSEAYAVGTRGGTPVSSDDPAYHNNSKWYNDNIAQQTVTPDNAVTLTNKTIDGKDNTIKCSPTIVSADTTITPTSEMNVVIDTDYACVTLASSAPYVGYRLPIVSTGTYGYGYVKFNSECVCLRKNSATFVWNGTSWYVESGATFFIYDNVVNNAPTGVTLSGWKSLLGHGTYNWVYGINPTGHDIPFDNVNIAVTWRLAATPVIAASAIATETIVGTGEENKSTRIWVRRCGESAWANNWTMLRGTQGTGAVHQVTLPPDVTGQVYYVVTNSICHLYVTGLNFSGLNGKTVSNVVPKAKLTGHIFLYQGNQIWVGGGSRDLNIYKLADIAINGSVDYPVADDWVES